MDRETWRRLERLVDEALELDEDGRAALLARVGAEDPALRDELASFLRDEVAARGLLEAPLERRAAALLRAIASEERSWDALQLEGRTVGPYRLLRELGRGGMGTVFLAERADGQFEHRVALKLVKRGLDSAEVLRRFVAERQIQARLQHGHIARLFDGGIDEAGQPYFVMEYVEGTTLDRFCDQAKLSIAERLAIMLQVCDAVEHAHRNLIVHRDLKPSNVLVSADGQAKLVDFGIAKVLDPTSGDDTVTAYGSRPLTPRYAAPELLLGEPVTTATDVYSLGVVLYELLSGRPPYRPAEWAGERGRPIPPGREPEPPSAAVRRSAGWEAGGPDSPEAIAALRGTVPDALVRQLRGDLDRIVGMATRREPARRYASVAALASDLRAFLAGRPVAARGESAAYRVSKFVARHRVGVGVAALLVASVVAGGVGTVWQGRRAIEQARKAQEIQHFVVGLFELSDPDAAEGEEITARELLARGAHSIETDLADQPVVAAEMLLLVGTLHHRLGQDAESRPLVEKALALRRRLFPADGLEVAEAEMAMGSVHLALGELEPAEELFGRALRTRALRLGEGDVATAASRNLLGRVRLQRDDAKGAEALLRRAVADLRRHAPAADEELATGLNALGRALQSQGDLAGARTALREALELRRRRFGEEHSGVSAILFNLAAVLQDQGDVRGAIEQYRHLLGVDRRRLGAQHEEVALDLNILASALTVGGEFQAAEALLREALAIYRRDGGESPRTAMTLHNLSRALRGGGKLVEAETSSRQALALATARLGEEHSNVAAVRQELAQILAEAGAYQEAEEQARRALATQRAQLAADHPKVADALVALGRVLLAAGRAEDAEPSLVEALRLRRRRFGDGDWRTAEAELELAACVAAQGRVEEASEHLRSTAPLERTFDAAHPLLRRASELRRRLGRTSTPKDG